MGDGTHHPEAPAWRGRPKAGVEKKLPRRKTGSWPLASSSSSSATSLGSTCWACPTVHSMPCPRKSHFHSVTTCGPEGRAALGWAKPMCPMNDTSTPAGPWHQQCLWASKTHTQTETPICPTCVVLGQAKAFHGWKSLNSCTKTGKGETPKYSPLQETKAWPQNHRRLCQPRGLWATICGLLELNSGPYSVKEVLCH